MSEVPDQTQAEMAIKLSENVRHLIRNEITAALEDPGFLRDLHCYALTEEILRSGAFAANPNFVSAVKFVISQQMQR